MDILKTRKKKLWQISFLFDAGSVQNFIDAKKDTKYFSEYRKYKYCTHERIMLHDRRTVTLKTHWRIDSRQFFSFKSISLYCLDERG